MKKQTLMTEGLIVGLGNPGNEYSHTRHNFGFFIIDALENYFNSQNRVDIISGAKDPFVLWKVSVVMPEGNEKKWFFAKPLTFMNKSGDAVQKICSYYNIPISNLLVLHDELDIPLGRIKAKKGGGNAGHNGLKSIQQQLGSADFHRIRLGIGKPAGYDITSWVLGKFSKEEQKVIPEVITGACKGVLSFMHEGETKYQQFCNNFNCLI